MELRLHLENPFFLWKAIQTFFFLWLYPALSMSFILVNKIEYRGRCARQARMARRRYKAGRGGGEENKAGWRGIVCRMVAADRKRIVFRCVKFVGSSEYDRSVRRNSLLRDRRVHRVLEAGRNPQNTHGKTSCSCHARVRYYTIFSVRKEIGIIN